MTDHPAAPNHPVLPVGLEALRQFIADADEIRGAYGYLTMRLAVAKDAEDAYDVCKREFEAHEAAFRRLEQLLSIPGLSNLEAHARLEAVLCAEPRQQERLRVLAKEAVNGWACHAKTKMEHNEIARLHREIDALEATEPRPPAAAAFTENEIKDVLTSLYQDGHVDLVLADRIASLMRPPAAAVDLPPSHGLGPGIKMSDFHEFVEVRASLAAPREDQ